MELDLHNLCGSGMDVCMDYSELPKAGANNTF